jgi:hypothetical protein
MPSWTVLPSYDPQHMSLYMVRQWCWSLEGGMASVYASVSKDAGNDIYKYGGDRARQS